MTPWGLLVYRYFVVRWLPCTAALAVLSVLSFTTVSSVSAQLRTIDHARLTRRLAERGLTTTVDLKALVVRVQETEDGTLELEHYDHGGTGSHRDGWSPSRTVILYAAVATLERLHELGFPQQSWVTFDYEEGPITLRMDHVLRHALQHGSTSAFRHLVEFVGFDRLNTDFFALANGFEDTVLSRTVNDRSTVADADMVTNPESALNRRSPRLVIRRGRRVRVISSEAEHGVYSCPNQGNCTSIGELAESMSRIMLHEELPEAERYDLRPADLEVLRQGLRVREEESLQQIVKEEFGDAPIEVYHRPGFDGEWASDVMFLHRTDVNERWVIVVAARPDRDTLRTAIRAISAILAAGEL